MAAGPRLSSPLISTPPGFSSPGKVLAPAFHEKDVTTGLPTGRVFDELGNVVFSGAVDPLTPVLLLLGDHPFNQWWGTTGRNGLAGMYSDLGLRPTLAVNTGIDCYASDPATYMPYSQIIALRDRVEIAAHGHLHPVDWRLINTGIKVVYTGANATATAQVTSTNLVLVDSGTTNLALGTYTTLTTLAAAVNAVPGWACTISDELTGSEASTKLLLAAARSAKTTALALCAGGGIFLTNTGTTYRRVTSTFNGTTLEIHCDGVRKLSLTISGNTLSQVVTAINAVGGGITAELTNDTPDNGTQYCSGAEDATCLATYKWTGRYPVTSDGIYLFAGINRWYIVDRQMQKCKDVLDVNGVTGVTSWMQPGNSFFPKEVNSHNQYKIWRGNVKSAGSCNPVAFRRMGNHIPHISVDQTSYPTPSGSRLTAILNALIDSPGHAVAALVHNLKSDGTSPYPLVQGNLAGWNQKESDWYPFLQAVAAARNAGASITTAVTAKEVAAAINAGMVANAATYGAEYHTIAKAVNGYVVLEAPYITGDVTSTLQVVDGTTAGARTAIFGDEVYAAALLAEQTYLGGVPVKVTISASFVGSATFGGFYLRKIVA